MELDRSTHDIAVTWRGKKFVVGMNVGATLEELGLELQKLTDVKADTMKLIVQSHKSSKLLYPFSNEHARLTLQETSIIEGKFIQMMGVPTEEVNQVLQGAKTDMRIAGFEEEEKRMRQRMSYGPEASLKLPQGNYVFCDFKTLSLPGIELSPPPSEALRLMHTLAADPGIVAIMNKHRWRVGIMTEMAPEGYVGVSPVCILGFNKNKGEEISLRLRTDDLKGFRKYQSIKKTLLHELAHMVFSEHDADFYALDKQLNREADTLDWTRSMGHTLSGAHKSQHHELEFHVRDSSGSSSRKLGGNQSSDWLANARAASVAAAYQRLVVESYNTSKTAEAHKEPDPDDAVDVSIDKLDIRNTEKDNSKRNSEPDPDDLDGLHDKFEPNPDDSVNGGSMESDLHRESSAIITMSESGPHVAVQNENEPDPDDIGADAMMLSEPDPDASLLHGKMLPRTQNPDDSQTDKILAEPGPGPDDSMVHDAELQRIQDPVMVACNRLKKSIEMLQSEVGPSEAATVIQTLFKIVRNVIEHPYETKFRKLRKANPVIQRNIASYKAAMEILMLIGFCEDIIEDEIGRAEAYLVLKRNDPGLLWLAKSSLETCIAC